MNIFIAGGGRVGFHLARLLSAESHDLTVIESDPNQVEQIDYALDVSTVHASAASALVQQEIGVADADLFISVTGRDEVNLVAAATAKGLGAREVVARVDDRVYLESAMLYESILNVDYILSPEALTALEIANYVENPGIVAAQEFGRGLVQMRQMRVAKSPTTNGKTLKDICPPGSGILVGMISRNTKVTIPHGDAIVEPGDLITLIGRRGRMPQIQKLFQGSELDLQKVVVMGGSSIGLHLAQTLENRQRSVKLFEWNLGRCNDLAAKLKKSKVVCRDATSRVSLEQEHVNKADVFIATTGDDERNIMASVLAKEVGVGIVMAVVHQPDFAPLVTRLGIDHAVTPRASLANRILKVIHKEKVTSLAVLEEGQVEIIEVPVNPACHAVGKRLCDIRFPKGALVATIVRGDTVIVPSGHDEIRGGDSVVLIVASDSLEPIQKLFRL